MTTIPTNNNIHKIQKIISTAKTNYKTNLLAKFDTPKLAETNVHTENCPIDMRFQYYKFDGSVTKPCIPVKEVGCYNDGTGDDTVRYFTVRPVDGVFDKNVPAACSYNDQ